MRMTYSAEADAMALWLDPRARSVGTKEIAPGVYADFGRGGRFLGLEILDARRRYPKADFAALPTPAEYLTLREAAAEEKTTPGALRAAIRRGKLAAVKRGRDWHVARHELWNYLENRR